MGIKESTRIHEEIIQMLNDNPDGMCVPLAIVESLPEGFPTQDQRNNIIARIIELLSKKGQLSNDEFWTEVVSYFWPGKSVDDISFRGAGDTELGAILNYVYEHSLPIIVRINKINHAVGLHFVQTEKYGPVLEFVYGLEGERPFIPLCNPVLHDDFGLIRDVYDDDCAFAIFPKAEKLN